MPNFVIVLQVFFSLCYKKLNILCKKRTIIKQKTDKSCPFGQEFEEMMIHL